MYGLHASAVRQNGRISVQLGAQLADTVTTARVNDKYPGGHRSYFADPGVAQVFIGEDHASGVRLDVLVPWFEIVDIADTSHEKVDVYVNEKKRLTVDVRGGVGKYGTGSALTSRGGLVRVPRLPSALPDVSFASRPSIECVIGEDDRQVVDNPDVAPWRWICGLHITAKTGHKYLATGWFIGPYAVATAGHCVFLQDEGGWAAMVDVYPALNGDEALAQAQSMRLRSVTGWVVENDNASDYGAILLEEPIGNTTGYFSFGDLSDAELVGKTVTVSGYPADHGGGKQQYFHSRPISAVTSTSVEYDVDTYAGQSGSPAWVTLDGRPVVVGVHTLGESTYNSALRINTQVMQQLRQWKRWTPG